MAAMYQSPLQTLNRADNYCRSYRTALNAKRKSAVELLEETKPLYVKSCLVLDAKQDLRLPQPSAQIHRCWVQPAAKSPKLVGAPQRRSNNSVGSDQLQTKLRRLLNADSKENLGDDDGGKGLWGARSDGTGAAVTQAQRVSAQHCKSLPDLSRNSLPTAGSCLSEAKSCEEDMSICKTLDTDTDSSEKSYGQPPSPLKSSPSLGGSAGKVELGRRVEEWDGVKRVVRSKSDAGQSLLSGISSSVPVPPDLDQFFQFLGLSSAEYSALTEAVSRSSSPVFLSGGSSASSLLRRRGGARPPPGDDDLPSSAPSIVESNARVIKWLCNCSRS